MASLEELWADLLSADAQRVQQALSGLADDEHQAVLDQLARMRDESGWHPTQRESAAAALRIIRQLAH